MTRPVRLRLVREHETMTAKCDPDFRKCRTCKETLIPRDTIMHTCGPCTEYITDFAIKERIAAMNYCNRCREYEEVNQEGYCLTCFEERMEEYNEA